MEVGSWGAVHLQDLMAQNIEKLETEVQQCQQKLQDVQTVRADLTETDKKLQAEKERIEGEREGILKQHNMQSKFKTKVATLSFQSSGQHVCMCCASKLMEL